MLGSREGGRTTPASMQIPKHGMSRDSSLQEQTQARGILQVQAVQLSICRFRVSDHR
uniref:SINA2 n=1 Tax=Arundo donax TaxID=35708 RepID=A0A0A9G9B2_ARUDO